VYSIRHVTMDTVMADSLSDVLLPYSAVRPVDGSDDAVKIRHAVLSGPYRKMHHVWVCLVQAAPPRFLHGACLGADKEASQSRSLTSTSIFARLTTRPTRYKATQLRQRAATTALFAVYPKPSQRREARFSDDVPSLARHTTSSSFPDGHAIAILPADTERSAVLEKTATTTPLF
jgi:hypothetical protein